MFYCTGKPCKWGHYSRRWVSNTHCKECYDTHHADMRKEWREVNKDEINERGRVKYYDNHAYERERSSRYYEENRETVLEKGRLRYHANPEPKLEYCSAHAKEYPELGRAKTLRYRSRKAGADGYHDADDIKQIYTMQYGLCGSCKASLEETGYHVDHIIPLSKGGSNWPDNLQCLCPRCNVSKGAKLPEEWAGYLP